MATDATGVIPAMARRTATADRGTGDVPDGSASSGRTLLPAVLAVVGVVAGLVVGALAGSGASPLLIAVALASPVVLVATMARPSLGLLVLVFIVFTHLSDVAVGVHGTPSVLQPYLLLLLAAVLMHVAWERRLPDGLGTPALLLLSYGIVLSLGLFFVQDREPTAFALNTFLRDAVVAMLVVALLRTGQHLERTVWVIVLSGGALAALGVLQYLTGSFSNEFGGFAQASIKNIASGQDDFRISGPIADPNHWAQALLVVSALALGRARRSRTWQVRGLAAGVLLASVLAIVFSFSRGALVALALTAVIVVCLRPPPAWSVALLGVAAVLALPLLPAGYVDRLGQLAQAVPGISDGRTGEASLSGRLSALVAGRDMALDQPLLGVGAGQFATRYREYSLGLGIDNIEGGVEPHNMYLEVAAETGYLGLLTWGAILGVALYRLHQGRRVLRRAARWHEADLMEDLSLGLVAYLLSGLFVHNAYPRLYWLLIGAALAAPAVVRSVLAARDDTRAPSDAADARRTAPVLARA